MILVVVIPLILLITWSFTLRWTYPDLMPSFEVSAWAKALSDKKVGTAFVNSLGLSLLVVLISLILSLPAAKYIGTRNFRGKALIERLLLVPAFIPAIAIVFGMQDVFRMVGLYSTYSGLLVAQLVSYVPYMTLLLSAVFKAYDVDYEQQAASLGIGKVNSLLYVTLPAVRSGVVVSCVFSFIGSWSVYLLTFVIGDPTFKTLPVLLLPMIADGNNSYPFLAAVTLIYMAPLLLALLFFSKLLVESHLDMKAGGQS
jgi:ABC-type spermidine/putrescine transport system permease subunit II